jgi:hypothetical protein
MKEEDLIKKLENARLPEAELPNHQRLLKTALLRRYKFASNKTAAAGKRRTIPIMNTIKGFLKSERPVWKKAMVSTSVIAVIFIVCLAVMVSSLIRDYEAMAMEVALDDPEVQEIITDEGIDLDTVKIVASFHAKTYTSYFIKVGDNKIVAVDISFGFVKSKTLKIMETVPVTETKKQELIEIASTDPEIKALFDSGASIYMYYFDYIPAYLASDSVLDVAHKASGQPFSIKDAQIISNDWVEFTVRFWFEFDGTRYYIMLDMLDKSVFSFGPLSI